MESVKTSKVFAIEIRQHSDTFIEIKSWIRYDDGRVINFTETRCDDIKDAIKNAVHHLSSHIEQGCQEISLEYNRTPAILNPRKSDDYVELGGQKFYYLDDTGALPQEYFKKRSELGLSNCPAASAAAKRKRYGKHRN